MHFFTLFLFAQIVPGPFYLPEKVKLELPDGWKDVLPKPGEQTPRLARVLEHKEMRTRITIVLAPPEWTGPGVAIGRLAKWYAKAGCRTKATGLPEETEIVDRSMYWERCPWAPGKAGKATHKRLGIVAQDPDDEQFRSYPLGPILQFSGSWPKRHEVPALTDFDKIMSSATVLP